MEEREISSAEVRIAKVQIEAARKSHAAAEGNKTIRWIFGCAAAAFSVYYLSGRFTFVEMTLDGQGWEALLSAMSQRPAAWASHITAAALLLLTGIQRRRIIRRDRKIREMGERIRYLETMINPGRVSSKLHPTGKTHPRDI